MDCIEFVLNCTPIPCLGICYTIFKTIWAAVEQVRASKGQFRVLAEAVAALLQALDRQHRARRISEASIVGAVNELESLLKEIACFIQKQSSYSFIRLLLMNADRSALINEFHQRLTFSVNAFQVAALLDIRRWQSKNDEARLKDQDRLHAHLRELGTNQRLLIEALDISQKTSVPLIATLQRCVNEQRGNKEELRFLTHSLQYLKTASGQRVDLKPWTITSFDVEFGSLIGVGGFSKVFRGKWNHTDVALKVMRNTEDITPRVAAILHEVETWSKLLHPNILQFLGANVLDDQPFLVMPLIEGGNARDYVSRYPDCNRLKIIQQIALGIAYLHSQNVVHGDLKAVNVLIDEGEKALLCDFGLARLKADVNSRRTTADTNVLLGSPNWMAPELFEGQTLRFPCDIYSFAMTVYEIFTHEIPLGSVAPAHLHRLVVEKHTRPDRPVDHEAPQLTEPIWRIVEQCWAQQPEDRPRAKDVCETLSALLKFQRRNYIGYSMESNSSTLYSPSTESSAYSSLGTNPPPVPSKSLTPDTSPRHSERSLSTFETFYKFDFESPIEGSTSFPMSSKRPLPVPRQPPPRHLERTTSTSPSIEQSVASGSSAHFTPKPPPAVVGSPTMTKGPRLVLAFDIGTVSSGISYSIMQPGQMAEIKGIDRFPDGKQFTDTARVSTNIIYDRAGNVRAIGAETMSKEIKRIAEHREWIKVKWFKLNFWPKFVPTQASAHTSRSLPPNKQAVEVLADYLRYLYTCTLLYLGKAHVHGWDSVDVKKAQLIFSYPNGWDGMQDQIRKAAVISKIVENNDFDHSRISFVTEAEANLYFILRRGPPQPLVEKEGVIVIVDAGEYMINISAYSRISNRYGASYQEITQPHCHLCGSLFVNSCARAHIQNQLRNSKYKSHVETMVEAFERTLKFSFRNEAQPEWLTFGSLDHNDKKYGIRKGQIKLEGTDISSFFDTPVQCIIDSVSEMRGTFRRKSTHIILLGELSGSEWIYKKVSETFRPLGYSVTRPDYYVNKAISDGAIFHHIDNASART